MGRFKMQTFELSDLDDEMIEKCHQAMEKCWQDFDEDKKQDENFRKSFEFYFKQGFVIGVREAKLQVLSNGKKMGLSNDILAKALNLTVEQIENCVINSKP